MKKEKFDRIRTKTSCLSHSLKVVFKGQSPNVWSWHIFNQKIKQNKNFLGIYGSSFQFFFNDAVNSFLKNASITHFKFVDTRPKDNKIL